MVDPTARPQNSPEEPVEEVDRDGSVLRIVPRSDMRAHRLRHRSVFVAVVSAAGEILVHQRSMSKDIWPGWWDIAVGGVVAPGENYVSAAHRELAEEIGVVDCPVEFLGSGAYDDSDVSLVAHCFLCRSDGPFRFADGEVVQTRWVPAGEILEWLGTNQVLPDSVALLLPRILGEGLHGSGLGFPT